MPFERKREMNAEEYFFKFQVRNITDKVHVTISLLEILNKLFH